MAKYEIWRVEDGAEARPFDFIFSDNLLVEHGAYIFYDVRKQAPDLVYPIMHFRVAKVEG